MIVKMLAATTLSIAAGVAPVAATASPRTNANDPTHDCVSNDRLTRTYSPAELRHALATMPRAVRDYTSCEYIIGDALNAKPVACNRYGFVHVTRRRHVTARTACHVALYVVDHDHANITRGNCTTKARSGRFDGWRVAIKGEDVTLKRGGSSFHILAQDWPEAC